MQVPGTVPGGYPEYPDPLRDDYLTVVMTLCCGRDYCGLQNNCPKEDKKIFENLFRAAERTFYWVTRAWATPPLPPLGITPSGMLSARTTSKKKGVGGRGV